jgi:acetylornithine/succinyldiaminopimelate/putrescine aminotransferase
MLNHSRQTHGSVALATPLAMNNPLDARRCTVQLANGHLYLDAIPAPAQALLGYDQPRSFGLSGSDVVALIDQMTDGYRCVAIAANQDDVVSVATTMARQRCGAEIEVRIVDGYGDEPTGTPEAALIALENESLGRSGRWFASATWRCSPDFVVMGDALSGGAPFAALLAATNNNTAPPAITCERAVLERVGDTIRTVVAEQLLDQVPSLDRYLRERLHAVRATCSEFGTFEFSPLRALVTLPNAAAAGLKRRLCERGVLVGLDSRGRIIIAPPLVIRPAEIDVISGALRAALMNRAWRPSLCCPACEAIPAN